MRRCFRRCSVKYLVLFSLVLPALISHAEVAPDKIVASARSQIGVTTSYDHSYRKLSYPGGDVPASTGVCADVIVRALRQQGIDLQKDVHEDMLHNFSDYPRKWGLTKPDQNIDHRRVPNLMTYFQRKGYALSIDRKPDRYAGGDIVAWDLGGGVTHIGIVSDKRSTNGIPLIIHNIGGGVQEENVLFEFQVIGHYRIK